MKSNNIDSKIQNWYADKYIVANVQKNILFVITIILSLAVFLALILVKYVYENRSVEPYLIEIDKRTGSATVVDTESVRKFTASEVIKESFVVKYIKSRETYKQTSAEDDRNLIRVLSSKEIYTAYTSAKNLPAGDMTYSERGAFVDVNIRSITFTSGKSAEVKITRNVISDGNILRKRYFKILIVFDFFDLDLVLEDRYLNPLGFQVVAYQPMEEVVSGDYDPDKEDSAKKNDNQEQNKQQSPIGNDKKI